MARRGTSKALSVEHEEATAGRYRWTGGKRSESSGGAAHDQGDVRTVASLIECKLTGSPAKPMKKTPKLLKEFEKIAREAHSEGRRPVLALRYYLPSSPLADGEGWIDLAVRPIGDDAEFESFAVDGKKRSAYAQA